MLTLTKKARLHQQSMLVAFFALCFGIVSLFVFAVPVSQVFALEMNDRNITWAVMDDLISDEAVASHLIDVRTENGIVTLTGSVDNLLAKERATELAERIKGVRSVVNRITVRPPPVTDQEIRSDIEYALLSDPAAEEYEVEVTVKSGEVTLHGTVDSWAEAQLCEEIAKGIRGVGGINNEIGVEFKVKRPDSEIVAEIKRRLAWDVWVEDAYIEVEVKDGEVTLTGRVGSAGEKTRAYGDALVAGVAAVDNSGLKVDWALHDAMRKSGEYTYKEDLEIQKAVHDAFMYDPRVSSFHPAVEVKEGVVTLAGTVDNLKAKKAAEEDAKNTTGVWRVKNYLRVRPVSGPSDAEIAVNVKNALLADPYVDRYEIGVSVVNGKVYLTGTVDSAFARLRAEEVASGLEGVVEIVNNMRLQDTWGWKTDWEIKEDIEDQLWWSPFVDSDQITVTVKDGVATLTGTVNSWQERGAAADNAYQGGAKEVRNHLRVKYGPSYYR
jgi:osmotically-inducible protein OsmY